MILAIGQVTVDSEKSIDYAEFYYNMLTEKQKAEVEHYDRLRQARKELFAAKEQTQQKAIEASKIEIPDVKGLSETDAKNEISILGLIPVIGCAKHAQKQFPFFAELT